MTYESDVEQCEGLGEVKKKTNQILIWFEDLVCRQGEKKRFGVSVMWMAMLFTEIRAL